MNPTDPWDRCVLRKWSLVATSWREPCQNLLFESVRVSLERLRSLQDWTSQNQGRLLSRVRQLTCDGGDLFDELKRIGPTDSDASLCDPFRLFTRLEQLHLDSCNIRFPPCELGLFSGSKDTVSSITLWDCTFSASALFLFINYFPNIDSLCFRGLMHLRVGDSTPQPSYFSRRLRKLSVGPGKPYFTFPQLFEGLSQLGLSFEELTICDEPGDPWARHWEQIAHGAVHAFGDGVKYLRVAVPPSKSNLLCLDQRL